MKAVNSKQETAEQICSHCHRDPGVNGRNSSLWNGFRDGDTGQLVCWRCEPIHYLKKYADTQGIRLQDLQFPVTTTNTRSEIPVPLKQHT